MREQIAYYGLSSLQCPLTAVVWCVFSKINAARSFHHLIQCTYKLVVSCEESMTNIWWSWILMTVFKIWSSCLLCSQVRIITLHGWCLCELCINCLLTNRRNYNYRSHVLSYDATLHTLHAKLRSLIPIFFFFLIHVQEKGSRGRDLLCACVFQRVTIDQIRLSMWIIAGGHDLAPTLIKGGKILLTYVIWHNNVILFISALACLFTYCTS